MDSWVVIVWAYSCCREGGGFVIASLSLTFGVAGLCGCLTFGGFQAVGHNSCGGIPRLRRCVGGLLHCGPYLAGPRFPQSVAGMLVLPPPVPPPAYGMEKKLLSSCSSCWAWGLLHRCRLRWHAIPGCGVRRFPSPRPPPEVFLLVLSRPSMSIPIGLYKPHFHPDVLPD
ncbi:hypothetical protein NDU88_001937 [Pleurodeles waltl]|uniref:Uncharacterized protein n=1 Tax=Pleurodeles waltl TaxID=8319 RepID=A0AAV7WM28_PLEWA|nr:hypothetical protein NDU88_001937 [Pleurodeles waltl]